MDALATVVTLLRPQAIGAKIINGSGNWGVRYAAHSHPGFALMLKGHVWLAPEGLPAVTLQEGDFVLFPSMPGFVMASAPDVSPRLMKAATSSDSLDEITHGDANSPVSMSILGGYFSFDPVNAAMLLNFLPRMLHVRAAEVGIRSVAAVVDLIQREVRDKRAGRALVLARLAEVMLVDALRSAPEDVVTTGLLAGLRDPRLATALSAIHARTAHAWTLAALAREAAMSRSSFAARFVDVVGTTPLNYLLNWRLAVAKDMLVRERKSVAETALAVGYESASGFSTAFSREIGKSPREFADSVTMTTEIEYTSPAVSGARARRVQMMNGRRSQRTA